MSFTTFTKKVLKVSHTYKYISDLDNTVYLHDSSKINILVI
jgi:hypothetical protein